MRENSFLVAISLRRHFAVFVAFIFCNLLLTALLFGCARQEVKNIGAKGKTIVCFGDSLTYGYGVNPGQAYPDSLKKMVKVPVINSGVDGDTTSDALKRINRDVLDHDPLLVIIEFGGNDYLKQVPKETTVENINKMVDMIQAKKAMVALVDISAGVFLNDYRAPYAKIAREKGTIFVPRILNGIITNPNLKSDFLHPNSQGYLIVAKRIYHSISPYLKESRNNITR